MRQLVVFCPLHSKTPPLRMAITRLGRQALRGCADTRFLGSDAPNHTRTSSASPSLPCLTRGRATPARVSSALLGDSLQGQRHGEPGEGVTTAQAESNSGALDSEGGKRPSLSAKAGMGRGRPQTEVASG